VQRGELDEGWVFERCCSAALSSRSRHGRNLRSRPSRRARGFGWNENVNQLHLDQGDINQRDGEVSLASTEGHRPALDGFSFCGRRDYSLSPLKLAPLRRGFLLGEVNLQATFVDYPGVGFLLGGSGPMHMYDEKIGAIGFALGYLGLGIEAVIVLRRNADRLPLSGQMAAAVPYVGLFGMLALFALI
jgi:hypothetical protein